MCLTRRCSGPGPTRRVLISRGLFSAGRSAELWRQTANELEVKEMSGRIAKSQIPVKSQVALPPDASIAFIEAKNFLKAGGKLRPFGNDRGNSPLEGPPLPDPSQGCVYYEKQVGHARLGDKQGDSGSKRLVLEVNTASKQIMEVYYTDEHYGKSTFVRIV